MERIENLLVISRADVKLVIVVSGSLIVRDGEPVFSILPDDPTRLSLEELTS